MTSGPNVPSDAAPRSSRYTKTIGALLVYAVYYNLAVMAKTWVETQVVAPFPGIWWVQALLLLIIGALLWLPGWQFRRAARRADGSATGLAA